MKDYVLRIKLTKKILGLIEKNSFDKEELPKITDFFYKPKGVPLKDFNPNRISVRERRFPDRTTLNKLETIKTSVGYSTKKSKIDNLEKYELWGKFTCHSILYKIKVGSDVVDILHESFSFGEHIKIEAKTLEVLNKTLKFFKVKKEDTIEKSSVVLLAEDMGLL